MVVGRFEKALAIADAILLRGLVDTLFSQHPTLGP